MQKGTLRRCKDSTIVLTLSGLQRVGKAQLLEDRTMNTPCIGLCRLDEKGVCLGCFRTIKEIKEAYEKTTERK